MEVPTEISYKRTISCDGGLGFRYETKMTALVALRLFQTSKEFYLASNLANAGLFDDIVFSAYLNESWSAWFIQLKHKQAAILSKNKIGVAALRRKGQDFLLRKYFESYKEIIKKNATIKNDYIFGKSEGGVRFVLYTNGQLQDDILQRSHEKVDVSLLCTSATAQNIMFNVKEDEDILLGMLGDPQLNDFLNRFYFCSSQASEVDIDAIVENEIKKISSTLSNIEIKYVTHQLYDYIFTRFKTGKYVIKDDVERLLSYTSIETQFQKKKESNLTFTPRFVTFIMDGLEKDQIIALESKADNTQILMDLLKQAGLLNEPNKLLQLKQLVKQDLRNYLLTEWSKLEVAATLVVNCKGETLPSQIDNIADFLLKLAAANTKNRILLITAREKGTNRLTSHIKAIKVRKFNCSLAHLTPESKAFMLQQEVLFQGYETQLSKLMPTKSLDDVFDMASMTQLLQGRMVDVGLKPIEHIPYYVPRMLTRRSCVSPSFFTDPQIKACFALSMITLENAIASFPPEIGIVSSLNLIDSMEFIEQRIIILEGDPETEFEALSKRVNLPFHWFEKSKKRKLWQWRKSTRNIEDVSRSVESVLDYAPTDNIMVIKDKVVVITAEPGMGKSTLVQHIAAETKRLLPHVWVITLALNDFTENLVKPEFLTNTEACTKDLIAAAAGVGNGISKFDARLFNQCYDVTGEMVVLLDGFDEITPYYTKQGLALLRTLQKSKVARVWVTARPVLCDSLEKATSTLSYNIKPFQAKDQKNFLTMYWKYEIAEINDEDLKEIVDKVLNLLRTSFDTKLDQFTGIPLQTRMLAEVFLSDIRKFCENGNLFLPSRINGVQLFEEFVRIKREIQMDKGKITVSNAMVRYEQKKMEERRERELMCLALLTLLPATVCANLSPPITKDDVLMFKEEVNEGHEKSGIVVSFKADCPQFIHRTFAEYFAGLFFSKNYSANRNFLSSDEFSDDNFEFVRYFFDRILSSGAKLHAALLNRDLDTFLSVIESGFDVNSVDAGGRTALHLAAGFPGSESFVTALLDAGANFCLEDAVLGWRPLQYAIKVTAIDNIALLIEESKDTLDPKVVPVTSDTLLTAVRGDYLQLLLHLLSNGIYAVESLDDLTPQKWFGDTIRSDLTILHLAAAYNAEKILRYLLRKDHRDSKLRMVECKDSDGMTPLLLAGFCGSFEAAQLLVTAGASSLTVSTDGKNLVQYAVEAQDLAMLHLAVKDALNRKAPAESFLPMTVTKLIGDKTDWGSSALQVLFSLYPKLAELKTTKGLPLLVASAMKGNAPAVERLCELGADVNFISPYGTPLHIAISGNHVEVVQALLRCPRTDPNLSYSSDFAPLYLAALEGYSDIFQALIDAGADIHCVTSNGSDLTHAVGKSLNNDIFFFLLQNDFNFKNKNKEGETGLSLLQAAMPDSAHLVRIIDPSTVKDSTEIGPLTVTVPESASVSKKKNKNKAPLGTNNANLNPTPANTVVNSNTQLNPNAKPKRQKKKKNQPKKEINPSRQRKVEAIAYDQGAFMSIFSDLASTEVCDQLTANQLKEMLEKLSIPVKPRLTTKKQQKTPGNPANVLGQRNESKKEQNPKQQAVNLRKQKPGAAANMIKEKVPIQNMQSPASAQKPFLPSPKVKELNVAKEIKTVVPTTSTNQAQDKKKKGKASINLPKIIHNQPKVDENDN